MSETLARRRRFAQMPDDLITDQGLSSHAVRVWGRLDRYAGRGGAAMPTREQLAEDLGLSLPTLRRAFGELVAAGWVTRHRIGISNVWETQLNDVPQDPGKGFDRGRPPAGERLSRAAGKRSDVSLSEDEKRSDPAVSDPMRDPNKRSRKRSQVSRPRKEKTNDSERTTSSHDGAQLAIIDATDAATTAGDDSASRRPTSDRGTRIPEDWYPDPALIEWTRQNAPDVGPADVEEFRNYWLAVPGSKGRKARWDLTWRNRALEVQGRRVGRSSGRPGAYDPERSRAVTLSVAEACERAGVSNLIELMIKESGE